MSVLDQFNLKGRCSIITGASTGLGSEMATSLAEAGSDIVIADIDQQSAELKVKELRAIGVRALALRTDVTSPQDVATLVDSVVREFGRIDVLVNNAGICRNSAAEDMALEDWNAVLDVNLTGMFRMAQAVGRIMIGQGKGSIINIASMSGLIVNTPQKHCAYNVSKGGAIMLTKCLAIEWAAHGIRVNAIAPGYMKTELIRHYFEEDGEMVRRWMDLSPMKRPGNPDEIKGLALYLASDASSFVTGSVMVIDGGYTSL